VMEALTGRPRTRALVEVTARWAARRWRWPGWPRRRGGAAMIRRALDLGRGGRAFRPRWSRRRAGPGFPETGWRATCPRPRAAMSLRHRTAATSGAIDPRAGPAVVRWAAAGARGRPDRPAVGLSAICRDGASGGPGIRIADPCRRRGRRSPLPRPPLRAAYHAGRRRHRAAPDPRAGRHEPGLPDRARFGRLRRRARCRRFRRRGRQHAGPYRARPAPRAAPMTGAAGPLRMPNLDGLGLGRAIGWPRASGPPGLGAVPQGRWGAATEVSRGKDTPSGHWELAGVPVPWEWTYFPDRARLSARSVAEVCRAGRDRRHPGQLPRRRHRHHRTSWAPSICAPAGRSATPRPTACSRSPRMRRRSGSTG
jgi:hypothetical protein